jgi:syntaxin-binding protein 1
MCPLVCRYVTGEASTGTIKKVVENLPKFMEQQAKLSVHTSIAAEINGLLQRKGLSGMDLHSSTFA